MAQSDPISLFGIHDIRVYDRTTFEHLAYYRILGSVTIDVSGEFAELKGGSQLFIWDSAVSALNSECTIVGRELNAEQTEQSIQADVTSYAASATGDVIEEENVTGTSVYGVATGILTITPTAGASADLKEGWYFVKAVTATTVDVYALSSAGFARGTTGSYEDDAGKITASPVTITASTDTDITDYGFTLTGGGGVIGMTIGDTAKFYVQKPHGGAFKAVVGATPISFDNVGLLITSEDNAGKMTSVNIYKVKMAGMSIPFGEKEFGEYNITTKIEYDSALNGIMEIRRTTPE